MPLHSLLALNDQTPTLFKHRHQETDYILKTDSRQGHDRSSQDPRNISHLITRQLSVKLLPWKEQGNDSAIRLIDRRSLIQRVRGLQAMEQGFVWPRSGAFEPAVKFVPGRFSKFKFEPISREPAGSVPISPAELL